MRDLDPPPRGFIGLREWLVRLHQFVLQLRVGRSPGTIVRQGRRGVSISALGGGDPGTGDSLQFKGQWVDGPYDQDDIVIRETNPELDNGNLGGTYESTAAVNKGDLPPGIPATGSGATFSLSIVTGVIQPGITVTAPGSGYPPGQTLPLKITGDGTGAYATCVSDETGVIVSATAGFDGGSGYTTASASVASVQKWVDFALGRWKKLTLRVGKKRIVIDAGRDGTDNPSIAVFKDHSSPTSGSFSLAVDDLLSIHGIESGANLEIKARITTACDDSDYSIKHAVVIRGDYYTPPA